jgi:hemerythrin
MENEMKKTEWSDRFGMSFLRDWWEHHILVEDMKYKSFFMLILLLIFTLWKKTGYIRI